MAKALPKFTPQVQPIADTTARKRNPDLASQLELAKGSVDSAVANGFANVAKVGGQIALKYRDQENQNTLALLQKELKPLIDEYKKEAAQKETEAELASYKDGVIEKINKIKEQYENNLYGNKAKRQLNVIGNSAMLSVDALAEQAEQARSDRDKAGILYGIFYDSQDIQKDVPINPETLLPFDATPELETDPEKMEVDTKSGMFLDTPKQTEDGKIVYKDSARKNAYMYAVKELQLLGQISDKQAASFINTYGQKTNYMTILNKAQEDPDAALKLMGELNISTEQQLALTKTIQAKQTQRDEEIDKIITDTEEETQKAINNNEISFTDLIRLADEQETVLGTTFTKLSPEFVKLAESQMIRGFDSETANNPNETDDLNEALDNISVDIKKAGRPSRKSLQALYNVLAAVETKKPTDLRMDNRPDLKIGDPIWSKAFIQNQIAIVNAMVNMNQENPTKLNMYEYGSNIIMDTFKEFFKATDNPKELAMRVKNIQDYQISFIEFLDSKEGFQVPGTNVKTRNPSMNHVNEWLNDNLGQVLRSNAYDEVVNSLLDRYQGKTIKLRVDDTVVELDSFLDYPDDVLINYIQEEYVDSPFIMNEAKELLK